MSDQLENSTKVTLSEENKSYQRGVVFGLTMAEVLLLLLFCFLIAFKWIYDEKQKVDKKNKELSQKNEIMMKDWETIQKQLKELKVEKDTKFDETDQELAVAIFSNIEFLKLKDPQRAKELAEKFKKNPETLFTSTIIDFDRYAELTTAEQFVNKLMTSDLYPKLADKPLEELNLLEERLKVLTELERDNPEIFATKENIKDVLDASQRVKQTEKELEKANKTINELKTKEKDSKGPPIINLPEAEEFSFMSGQAVLSTAFSKRLTTDIKDKILKNLKEYEGNIIEVIGHTDEVAVGKKERSTLDANTIAFILGQDNKTPVAMDNAGLGFARAVAVLRVLRTIPELKEYEILPYSAGQLILPNETLTSGLGIKDDAERRRIEIRVRRRKN